MMATPIWSTKFLCSNFIYLSLLVWCICSFQKAYAYRGKKALNEGPHFPHRHLAQVNSLLPSSFCRPSAKNNDLRPRTSLLVVHKHGPCSQLSQEAANTPSLAQMLTQDQYRVDWIQSRIADSPTRSHLSDSKARLLATSGLPLGSGNFIVTIGLGTPKKDLRLAFDTGSDLTWTQCRPCAGSCYNQSDPLFDPTQSMSYSNISCGSPECSQLATATSIPPGCVTGTCRYAVQYGDQSYTIGLYGKERLTLTPIDSFDFLFGCGQNNSDQFGQTAGILGLGRGPVSIVAQTSSKYGKVFSYCLPPSSGSAGGFLSFGMCENCSSIAFTPLASPNARQDPSFYFLELVAISVGGKTLPIPGTVFSARGTIIDSGTVVTRLPPEAYSALRSAFRQQMANYTLTQSFALFDTCYDLSQYDNVLIPTIGLHFTGNVTVNVDVLGTLIGPSTNQLCLAFAGNGNELGVGIFGNLQQVTYNIVYDVAGGRVGFGRGGCS